jgi:hypothetical protein
VGKRQGRGRASQRWRERRAAWGLIPSSEAVGGGEDPSARSTASTVPGSFFQLEEDEGEKRWAGPKAGLLFAAPSSK